jgi:hypothetical protein
MSWTRDANRSGGQTFGNISFFVFESRGGIAITNIGFETCHPLFEGWSGRIGPSSRN